MKGLVFQIVVEFNVGQVLVERGDLDLCIFHLVDDVLLVITRISTCQLWVVVYQLQRLPIFDVKVSSLLHGRS